MTILAWVLIGYGSLVLLVCIAGAIAGLLARRQDRRLSWCPSCGEACQSGYCQNCADRARDHRAMDGMMRSVNPADWREAADAIQDDEALPAWQGVVRREREEARERAVLDRRAQERRGGPVQRDSEDAALREFIARTVLHSVGCFREVAGR